MELETFDNTSTFEHLTMPTWYYLFIDIVTLILHILSAVGNGFIIYLFFKTKSLWYNLALRLILLLCISDFGFAVTGMPYIIYYTVYWNPVLLDYPPFTILVISSPLLMQFKLNLIITIAIAIDRLQAMKTLAYYRKKNHMFFVWMTLGVGLGLGIGDVALEFYTAEFDVHRYHCAGIGCFQDIIFRAYWGISNMVLNVIALFLTIAFALALNSFQTSMSGRELLQLKQANRLSIGILIISMIFLLVPSTLVGIIELFHLEVFKTFGPFYQVGLILAGASNSVIYITQHVEIKHAVQRVFYRNKSSLFNVTGMNSTVVRRTGVHS